MIRYHIYKILKTPPKSKKKELVNEFSKIAEYKINIQKPIAFLYTSNELYEKEIKKTIPFIQ